MKMIVTPQATLWWSIDIPNGLPSWDESMAWAYECPVATTDDPPAADTFTSHRCPELDAADERFKLILCCVILVWGVCAISGMIVVSVMAYGTIGSGLR